MWGLHAPLPAEHDEFGVVLILAFYTHGVSSRALFVCDDGRIRDSFVEHMKTEWRFNWATHVWEDFDTGDLYDQTSDGSPEIPGDIPDIDGADRSDPSDQGDGAIGSLVSE